ncbi:YlmH family RNA-binding protein [Neobacillus sp. Marseille-QA0830]
MNIYQHFRPEEREYIDQVLQWKSYVDRQYSPKITDFLDPREQHILKTIIGESSEVKYGFFGGREETERNRALLFPDYLSMEPNDFQISLFEVDYPKKFVTIEHRQVLGTLMSLGLKRGKFGDILIHDGRIQFFAAKEISDYIKLNVDSIGRAGVKLVEIPMEQAIISNEMWESHELTVSSLRLDTIISGACHLSRQKSLTLIQHGLVKVNWTQQENPSFPCAEGDLISVRGHGRTKLMGIEGKTKKDKWKILIGVQK